MADEFETVDEAVEAIAKGGVKKASDPNGSIEHFTPKEMLEGQHAVAANAAASTDKMGIRMRKCVPPGCG
jgi:hypothetical protein